MLEAISGAKGRGKSGLSPEQVEAFDSAVAALEKDGGVQVWRLRPPTKFERCTSRFCLLPVCVACIGG